MESKDRKVISVTEIINQIKKESKQQQPRNNKETVARIFQIYNL